VVSFSLKARSAVTLGGHRPVAVTWFDDAGTWVTSSAFSSAPVAEIADYIRGNPVENDMGTVWDRARPVAEYLYTDPAPGNRGVARGMTAGFPHVIRGSAATADRVFYDRWQGSPLSDDYLARMTMAVAERL